MSPPAPASLTIDPSSGPLESTVRVSGILVIDTSTQLRRCLLHITERRVSRAILIDLSGVTHLEVASMTSRLATVDRFDDRPATRSSNQVRR